MPITKEQALHAQEFHANGCTCEEGPRGGKKVRVEVWRRNGATQTWKTRPDDFRIPVKFGIKTYGQITDGMAHNYHAAEDCPLLKKEKAPHV